jgi:hypothetical protein
MFGIRSIKLSRSILTFSAVALLAALGIGLTSKPAAAEDHAKCPHGPRHRTAQQTIEQHLALMQAGKTEEALADYAKDAVVILPGQVIRGRDEIAKGLMGVGSLLGGAVPEVLSLTATDNLVMITFKAMGVPCTIPDGSDTYVVEKGQIVAQTVHDTFHSAAGVVCPAAAPGQ